MENQIIEGGVERSYAIDNKSLVISTLISDVLFSRYLPWRIYYGGHTKDQLYKEFQGVWNKETNQVQLKSLWELSKKYHFKYHCINRPELMNIIAQSPILFNFNMNSIQRDQFYSFYNDNDTDKMITIDKIQLDHNDGFDVHLDAVVAMITTINEQEEYVILKMIDRNGYVQSSSSANSPKLQSTSSSDTTTTTTTTTTNNNNNNTNESELTTSGIPELREYKVHMDVFKHAFSIPKFYVFYFNYEDMKKEKDQGGVDEPYRFEIEVSEPMKKSYIRLLKSIPGALPTPEKSSWLWKGGIVVAAISLFIMYKKYKQ